MKLAFALALVMVSATTAMAQYIMQPSLGGTYDYGTGSNPNSQRVSPHTTQSGTYVAPHYQTNPNKTQMDNYVTRGNLNPYTGQYGTTRAPRY
jgi:hypothetical protein